MSFTGALHLGSQPLSLTSSEHKNTTKLLHLFRQVPNGKSPHSKGKMFFPTRTSDNKIKINRVRRSNDEPIEIKLKSARRQPLGRARQIGE
jgi:hypothetical protein